MSLRDKMKADQDEFGTSGSGNFKFDKTGVYRLRILTEPVAMATHFFGKGQPSHICYGMKDGCPFHGADDKKASVKYEAYIVDRLDGKVKMAEFPWSVIGAIADLEEDEDFAFTAYPMPYDIKVTFDKENDDPKQMYKTLGSPKAVPVTEEEQAALDEKMKDITPEAYVEKRKLKEIEKQKEDGTWQAEQDRRATLKAEIDEAKSGSSEGAVEYPANDDEIPF